MENSGYLLKLMDKMQGKFFRAFDKTEPGLKGSWSEKLNSEDGIFESRERDQEKFSEYLHFGMENLIKDLSLFCKL